MACLQKFHQIFRHLKGAESSLDGRMILVFRRIQSDFLFFQSSDTLHKLVHSQTVCIAGQFQ